MDKSRTEPPSPSQLQRTEQIAQRSMQSAPEGGDPLSLDDRLAKRELRLW
ncbi:hypothetical protein LMG28614_07216 [Paraburkholderia ultramafica]|uniref:Uncharacterized protein n=1 Tax=Paraburkholderia ultramafica TaxID=1544867 RepID=A0A6S7BQQ2_9BURK|nr:hypothetical protein LMG28614_07216 [Paraburkholderia ultramafica]